uniref:Methyltransferase type 11 domain-containing protein n=1 Tax=Paramoeba aestuarina TaxID=180227 RepID=A0A7S4U7S3_9EUKA|mmetsp:Transcript_5726/g.8652  ORF Transcript_5726/g.8652 Transcript_5726/m.8652 type:complete len:112 (+) Transcript_5726:149-484(+)
MTEKMLPFFDEVIATEVSSSMVEFLRSRNITTLHTGDLSEKTFKQKKFNVISCFNVLDRCDKPLTLLKQIHDALVSFSPPSSPSLSLPPLFILAVVFPFVPFVEMPGGQSI